MKRHRRNIFLGSYIFLSICFTFLYVTNPERIFEFGENALIFSGLQQFATSYVLFILLYFTVKRTELAAVITLPFCIMIIATSFAGFITFKNSNLDYPRMQVYLYSSLHILMVTASVFNWWRLPKQ
jgi:hypothetical protein